MKFHIPKISEFSRNTYNLGVIADYLDRLRLKLIQCFENNLDDDNIKSMSADKLTAGIYCIKGGRLVLGTDNIRLETCDGTQYIELKDGVINVCANVIGYSNE